MSRPEPRVDPPSTARPAAVLVPLYETREGVFVVLTKRTEEVPHHKGQISFPGGKWATGDDDLVATALRETAEEIGLAPDAPRIVTRLTPFVTITDFFVTPFVAVIPADAALEPEEREIAAILHVPLAHLRDPANQRTAIVPFRGRMESLHYFDFGPHVIWGVTGRIIRQMLDIVEQEPPGGQ